MQKLRSTGRDGAAKPLKLLGFPSLPISRFPSLPISRLVTPVSAKLCFVPRGLREGTHRRTGALAVIGGLGIGDSKTGAFPIWRLGTRVKNFLRESPRTGLSGLFYCQLMDVETECEGVISYDREVPKIDAQKVAEVIQSSTPEAVKQQSHEPMKARTKNDR